MTLLPVKYRVLQLVFQHDEISNDELYKVLKKEYPLDRFVNEQGIDECLISLKAVGMVKVTDGSLTDTGRLIQRYQITARGLDKMKYINDRRDDASK